jgi:hypothetical protein
LLEKTDMGLFKAVNPAVQLMAELKNFISGAYPPFVFGSKSAPKMIPVFSFHDLDPVAFEAQCRYLAENDYKTVTIGKVVSRGGLSGGEKVVCLTFDDGHASLWRIGYPLLKKYGLTGVAFVVAGELQEADKVRPFDGERSGDPLITWAEARAMGDRIDIQSHSWFHQIMFVDDKLTDFYTPAMRDGMYLIDRPIIMIGGEDQPARDYPIGTPLYHCDSRLGSHKRFFAPASVRDTCVSHVAANGGNTFFGRPGWRDELTALHDTAMDKASFTIESEADRIAAIGSSLTSSKELIEKRLDRPIEHFCLPFAIGSQVAVNQLAAAHYKSVWWGATLPAYIDVGELYHGVRLKDDFLYCLPGRGRWSLLKVMSEKLKRRLRHPSLFHAPDKGNQRRRPGSEHS